MSARLFRALVLIHLSIVLVTTVRAGNRSALVIGVDRCEALGVLTVCCNDARAFQNVLLKGGYSVTLLVDDAPTNTGQLPTYMTVRKEVEKLVSSAGKGDTVLVFFSGHGFTHNGESFLAPTDGDRENGVSLAWVRQRLASSPALQKLAILDACRTDSAKGVLGLVPNLKGGDGVVMFYSCAEGQVSWPDAETGHSVFTRYLLEGLGGKAGEAGRDVTHTELFDYVTKEVRRWTFTKHKNLQSPLLDAPGVADGVILIRKPTTPPSPSSPFSDSVTVKSIDVSFIGDANCTESMVLSTIALRNGSLMAPRALRLAVNEDFKRLFRTGQFSDVGAEIQEAPGNNVRVKFRVTAKVGNHAEGSKVDGSDTRHAIHNLSGIPPLCMATQECNVREVKKLLDEGVKADEADQEGNTPLDYLFSGYEAATRKVSETAMVATQDTSPIGHPFIEKISDEERSKLAARSTNSEEIAVLLMGKGIDVNRPWHNASTARRGQPAFVCMLLFGWMRATSVAISKGANVKEPSNASVIFRFLCFIPDGPFTRELPKARKTVLKRATANLGFAESLLNRGVDINTISSDGLAPPLTVATQSGFKEMAGLLLKHGVDVNCQDSKGRTAMFWWYEKGESDTFLEVVHRMAVVDTVALLIKHGADVNATDKEGNTPLMAAARAGFPELCDLLVKKGANVNVRNHAGMTALAYAEACDPKGAAVLALVKSSKKSPER